MELLEVVRNKRLMGVVLGWPDKDDPVNRFERKRAPLDEIVQWVS